MVAAAPRPAMDDRLQRQWWAHVEFTRINIELTILPKKFEDLIAASAQGRFRLSVSAVEWFELA